MNFWQLSDGIRLHHPPHHGHDGHGTPAPGWLDPSSSSAIDTGDNSAGDGGDGFFSGSAVNAPVVNFSPHDIAQAGIGGNADSHQSNLVQIDQHAAQMAGIGGNGGSDNIAAGGHISALDSGFGSVSGGVQSGADTAGNGGDGYFYGSMIHASMVVYEPINITVAMGYDSTALAGQTNNVSIDQSAVQMAGIGGNGGDGNIASGGNVGISSFGSGMITTGGNSAGNGGEGYFSGSLVNAPVVIYDPINIAVAGAGGTADANQSNTVDINQSVIQMAGIGGNGGSGNFAIGGSISMLGFGSGAGGSGWDLIQTGGSHAGNGGDGSFSGSLVHTSVAVYDPVNISVAGYNSNTSSDQINNVNLDQSSSQTAGIGGNGGNANVAAGGNASLVSSGLASGSDAISSGGNSAGDGGSGHVSGSLIDVSVAIYAPINIAVAGPHSTAEADQINTVHIDQSMIQIAGIGGDGGNGNVALGGDVAMHLLSDLHLLA